MAGIVGVRWNQISASLITIYRKLDVLGFVLNDGEVSYPEPEAQDA
jgi:hypothetical protein